MNGEYPNDPLYYACPSCGMGSKQRCRTTSGTNRTTDTHLARVKQRDDYIDRNRVPKVLKTN